jgi:hypothetical protein
MSLSGTERCSRVAAAPIARAAPPRAIRAAVLSPVRSAALAARPLANHAPLAACQVRQVPGHEAWPPGLLRDFRALLMIAMGHDGLLATGC